MEILQTKIFVKSGLKSLEWGNGGEQHRREVRDILTQEDAGGTHAVLEEEWTEKPWCIHTIEHHLALKNKKEILHYVAVWVAVEDRVPSETS